MARRRKFFSLPFRFRINKRTFVNIIGFLFLGLSLILFLSFTQSGSFLILINNFLTENFGFLAIFISFLTLLFATHFFNSKNLKIIQPHITLGFFLILIAVLGAFQSGNFGRIIFENLSSDFSVVGAIIILTITFIIGLIVFLNTSVDSFLLFLFEFFKLIINFNKKYLFRHFFEDRIKEQKKEKKEERKEEFIKDTKTNVSQVLPPIVQPAGQSPKISLSAQPSLNFQVKPLNRGSSSTWVYPPITLLSDLAQKEADRGDTNENAEIIERTLDSFGIRAKVAEVNKGPSVTQYALEIVRGTKLSRITALSNDLALALAAPTGQVRIEAPIPGRSLVGIEIPNKRPEIVTLKRMLMSSIFANNSDVLLVPLGLDVSGVPQAAMISKMPHVLIAGTTGSGKSVLLNSWICTFLFRAKPDELRLILVDPKRVELTLYNGIPHLLTEVIVEPKEIISALKWTVGEMENRYKMFAKVGARNIEGYNQLEDVEKIPYIVLIIDELADLMIFAPADAENLITRIAQMARATGIHLVLATQRPSVDVITGLMKANIPARVAFNVASMIDSRVVLDMPGAEKLLGRGDMLYLPPDQAKPRRIQGPFISEKEVSQVVKFLKQQNPTVHYTEEVVNQEVSLKTGGKTGTIDFGGEGKDPLFNQAIEIISQFDKASASLLQRKLSIGYARAARLLDQLEAEGYVGPAEGSKPREVLRRNIQESTNLSLENQDNQ